MRNRFPAETVYTECRLCPRNCGADRGRARGFCRAPDRAQVYTYGPHHGEEPPVSGSNGSGTVFFSHCNMRCLYCQNHPWSSQGRGQTFEKAQLAGALEALYRRKCHNWNLVTPTPWLPDIVEALDAMRHREINLPVVYNTSGYETVDTLAAMDDWVNVYLTDLRYADPVTAAEASQAPDYVETARAALLEMWRRKGPLEMDAEGIALQGVICRILVLPGRAGEALDNLRWLARNIGTDIAVSLMAQYTPAWQAVNTPGWDRKVTAREYHPVAEAISDWGFSTGWMQDIEAETPPPLLGYNMVAADPAEIAAVV